ncbi:MAG: undecaprenyl/decaprenyl-phosphate alpha-N-acetylglucosaminyl 1-phosphate transferase [Myxococcales bacterium]|nr:undecaprenyl/decaprenyl-phosphate alpha-N-acetylglucosaminyl 1-phosphate transferase [Myxococcales bacterium]
MKASLDTVWVAAVGAFVVTAGVMPLVLRAWAALGARDREVSLRKVHTGEIPRAGGLVMLFGFGVMLLAGLAGNNPLSSTHSLFSVTPLTGGLLGALVVALTGLYDDLVGLRARHKLLMQLVAAGIAVLYGLHWPALELLVGWEHHWLAQGLTIAFLVAAVNAINLMDGLDGLAGGIAFIGFATVLSSILAAPLLGSAHIPVAWIAACALGAVGGFLVFNRHPARVFMGDSGSYLLGFLLAVLLLHIRPVRWRVPEIQLAIPLLVLTVPFFDMGMAMVRRKLRGQPMFASDADHVHHRLLARGLSHARAVTVLWACTAMFALLAYLNVLGVGGWWTLLGTVVALVLASVLLGYHRLLTRLPAFSGERRVGWRDRRREVMEILAILKRLEEDGSDDQGVARWRRLAPEVGEVLQRLGVPGFEVRVGSATVVEHGSAADTWAWLSLPLRGDPQEVELRLALAVRLPDLQQEQLMLLERVVSVMAGSSGAARQWVSVRGPLPRSPDPGV